MAISSGAIAWTAVRHHRVDMHDPATAPSTRQPAPSRHRSVHQHRTVHHRATARVEATLAASSLITGRWSAAVGMVVGGRVAIAEVRARRLHPALIPTLAWPGFAAGAGAEPVSVGRTAEAWF